MLANAAECCREARSPRAVKVSDICHPSAHSDPGFVVKEAVRWYALSEKIPSFHFMWSET